MLTATYSLVAIATEQEKTRTLLKRLQQFIEASWKSLQSLDFSFLEAGYHRMMQFDHFLRNRKIELFLVPALKEMTHDAELLMGELDALRAKAGHALQRVGAQLAVRMEMTRVQVSDVCDSMQAYCHHVAARLSLEEQSLLPLARRLLTVEDWFRLASDFMSRDGGHGGRSRVSSGRSPGRMGTLSDLH